MTESTDEQDMANEITDGETKEDLISLFCCPIKRGSFLEKKVKKTRKEILDEKILTVLEKERLVNELSLVESQLTDSSSKLQMFQNVREELATIYQKRTQRKEK
jgi:hypothetical protein